MKRHQGKTYGAWLALMALGLSLFGSNAFAARCDWTVNGQVMVDYDAVVADMDQLGGPVQPLENIQVRVAARAKTGVWGTWNNWNVIRTDANGNFSITKEKNCNTRQFKVEVKFDDDRLELRHRKSTSSATKVKWYELANDKDQDRRRNNGGTVNFGTFTFGESQGGVLGQLEPRRHAMAWNIFAVLFDKLDSYGANFAFTGKLKVKYPHDGIAGNGSEESYANPITKVVYIHRSSDSKDRFNIGTLWHEVFHIWDYQHVGGENCLTADLILTQDTHDLASTSCPAFHEGFAEAASEQLQTEVFGDPRPAAQSRQWFVSEGLFSVGLVERLGLGWESVFRTMMTEDLQQWTFSGSGDNATQNLSAHKGCTVKSLGLKQLLNVFLKHPDKGYPDFMVSSELHVEPFFDRAVNVLNRLDRQHANAIINAQDPMATGEPADILCADNSLQASTDTVIPELIPGVVRPGTIIKPGTSFLSTGRWTLKNDSASAGVYSATKMDKLSGWVGINCTQRHGADYMVSGITAYEEPSGNLDNFIGKIKVTCANHDSQSATWTVGSNGTQLSNQAQYVRLAEGSITETLYNGNYNGSKSGKTSLTNALVNGTYCCKYPKGVKIVYRSNDNYVKNIRLYAAFPDYTADPADAGMKGNADERWALSGSSYQPGSTRTLGCPTDKVMTGLEVRYHTKKGKIRAMRVLCRTLEYDPPASS